MEEKKYIKVYDELGNLLGFEEWTGGGSVEPSPAVA